jgi:hypothetical protein
MFENSQVAQRLAAYPEGLNSVVPVSKLVTHFGFA